MVDLTNIDPARKPELAKESRNTLKIGLIVPSSNTVLEPEICRLVGPLKSVTAHFSRLSVTRVSLDSKASAQFGEHSMLQAAELLADAFVDVIAWGGTAGSWLGVDHDYRLVDSIETKLGVPSTTSTLALLDACQAFGVARIGLVTPYTDKVVRRIEKCYAGQGVEVVAERHLGLSDNHSFGKVGADEVTSMIQETAAGGAQAVVVACTNLASPPLGSDLEASVGIPVFDSTIATLWGALQLVGRPTSILGHGTLMSDGTFRSLLQAIAQQLLKETGADRTTVRLDMDRFELKVDLAAAEAVKGEVPRIAKDSSLDQRGLSTVRWLEEQRTSLIQSNFAAAPFPPSALVEVYGVKAQMLGPIIQDGRMVGWVSIHSRTERRWTTDEVEMLHRSVTRVAALMSDERFSSYDYGSNGLISPPKIISAGH